MRTGHPLISARVTPSRVRAILLDLLGMTAFIALMFVAFAPFLLIP